MWRGDQPLAVFSCIMRAGVSPIRLQRRLGLNIRHLRQSLGITQDELASRAGLDARHVQKLESGQVNATLKTIAVLAGALQIDPAALLRELRRSSIRSEARDA
jgi:transcriptional regulator with XRE-family HTH domain